MVFFHASYPELNAVCITDDNEGGAYQAAEYLIQRGHTRIGGIFKSDEQQGMQRCLGLFTAMRDHGLPYPEEHILWYTTEQRAEMMDEGRSPCISHYLRNEGKDRTAILCHNDEIAHGLMQTLETMGLHVPEDVAVCSFDNIPQFDCFPFHRIMMGILVKADAGRTDTQISFCIRNIRRSLLPLGDTCHWVVACSHPVTRISSLPRCFAQVMEVLAYSGLQPDQHILTPESVNTMRSNVLENQLNKLNPPITFSE